MVAKKHKSNRVKAKDKYKIKAKVREHARKVRKLAKQNPKKTKKVVNHVPNDFPFKEELLVEAQNYKAEKSLLMQQKKAAVDAEPIESEKVLPVLKLYPKVYEMWKDVVNDSDFIIQVIDAREPVFSRAMELETLVQKQKKKLLIILTKCDLVPASNLKEWVAYYSKFCPTVPFSKNHCTSESVLLIKEYLLQLKAVKIGIVGFPGVGKSTVIAFLRKEVDCPTHCGIIFSKTKNEAESSAVLFRNYSNAAKIPDPVHALKHLVNKVGLETICNYYKVAFSANIDDFIIQIARKQGFIRRHGIPDTMSAARFVLHEYYENGLPIFTVFSAEYPIFKSKFKALDVEALLNLEQDGTSQILKGNAARPVPVDLDMESLPKGYTGRYETDGDQSAESDSNDSDAEMQNIDEEFEFGEFYQPETL